MSVIASLKNIDLAKYATVRILDAIGIDIDMEDGHIYYPQDPAISIDINDKILRVDIGKPNKHINYSTFNPILREDHAQFLMTLLLHAEIMDNFIDAADTVEADFTIREDTNITDDDGNYQENPTTTVTIVDKDEKEHGNATHIDPVIAICLAIINYGVNCKWIPKDQEKELINDIINAYNDRIRINDLSASVRRTEMKTKKAYWNAPVTNNDEELIDTDFEDLPISAKENEDNITYADSMEDNMDITDNDFEESDNNESFTDEDFIRSTDNDPDFLEFLESNENTESNVSNITIEEPVDKSDNIPEVSKSLDNSDIEPESSELDELFGTTNNLYIPDSSDKILENQQPQTRTVVPMMPQFANPYIMQQQQISMMNGMQQAPMMMNNFIAPQAFDYNQQNQLNKFNRCGFIQPQMQQNTINVNDTLFPAELNQKYEHFNIASINNN